jgi:hypothetical protein
VVVAASSRQRLGIYVRHRHHACAGERRQRRNLQFGERRAAEARANPRSFATGSVLGTDQAHHLPVVELTYRTVEMFSRQSRGFSQIAAMGSTTWPAWLRDRGAIQRISTAGVTARFVETLGVAAVLGRTIRPEDDTANAPPVVLLSYGTWVSRFGADPGIIGTQITLNDQRHTVIGVMPRGFDVPRGAEVWTPVVPILAASGPEALDGGRIWR